MNRSDEINELAEALSKAQGEFDKMIKDKKNPHFRSSYADLAQNIKSTTPALAKHGLTVTQHPQATSKELVSIETVLMHKSGQWMSSLLTLATDRPNIQGIGSAITYGCRYARNAILGIAGEDDDGEKAIGRNQQYQAKPYPAPKPEPKPTLNLDDAYDPSKGEHKIYLKSVLDKLQITDKQDMISISEVMAANKVALKNIESNIHAQG